MRFFFIVQRHHTAIVTDLDENSKVEGKGKTYWRSFYMEGTLTRNTATGKYSFVLDPDETRAELRTRLNLDDRGMELSWLQRFNGRLYSGDDRSGVAYDIDSTARTAAAAFVFPDGNGREEKGFKSEWATVKGGSMYVGSFGKEWSSAQGEFINDNPQWIQVIDKFGGVTHVNWRRNWEALREKGNYGYPGYLYHESCLWSDRLQRWIFVPRRASHERYDEKKDETMGANLIFIATEDFSAVEVRHVQTPMDAVKNLKGFSEIKLVPGRDEIVALRTQEYEGETFSWMMVFDLDGKVLMEEVPLGPYKYEGLEIL